MRLGLVGLIKFLLFSVATISIVVSLSPTTNTNSIERHLNEFTEFTIAHHENIDDTQEDHSHTHRHSKDGDEHEHNHDHSKSAPSTFSLMYFTNYPHLNFLEIEATQGFTDVNLISDPHAFGIFRPPIV